MILRSLFIALATLFLVGTVVPEAQAVKVKRAGGADGETLAPGGTTIDFESTFVGRRGGENEATAPHS